MGMLSLLRLGYIPNTEKKRKEKTTPFGISLTISLVIYQAAQISIHWCTTQWQQDTSDLQLAVSDLVNVWNPPTGGGTTPGAGNWGAAAGAAAGAAVGLELCIWSAGNSALTKPGVFRGRLPCAMRGYTSSKK